MSSQAFKPTARVALSTVRSLHIQIVSDKGDLYVLSAFFDADGKMQLPVTKSRIRETYKGHPYFIRNRERYYLSEFTKIHHPNKG